MPRPAEILFLLLLAVPATAQADQKESRDGALKIFLDCASCDFDYFRTEIAFVNYVQDKEQAQLHVLVTTQQSGGGGTEYTISLIGNKEFRGADDVLVYHSHPADTDDAIRRGLLRQLKLGLARYAAKTPLAENLNLSFEGSLDSVTKNDPWHSWVFNLNAYESLSGEKSRTSGFFNGALSADRVTPDWKTSLSPWVSYSESKYDIGDQTVLNISRAGGLRGLQVMSLTDHWSAGLRGQASTSSYDNTRLALSAGPAAEYDIFPYSQSTRRQLTLLYTVYLQRYRYFETTIYNKDAETLQSEALSATLSAKEPWGTMNASLEATHYFHDLSKHRATLTGNLSFRIVQGLSLTLSAQGQVIHDQLSLPRLGASDEDILLQRVQLATQYNYYTTVGFSYTFGSIYNNVVNPRFGN